MSDTELGLFADATGVGSPTPSREQEEQLLANESQFGTPPASALSEPHESLRTLMGEISSIKREIRSFKQDKRKAAPLQQADGDTSQPSPTGPRAKKLKTAPQPSTSTALMEWDDSPGDQAERHLIELARGPIEEEVAEGEEEGVAANEILDDLRSAFDSAEQRGPPVADSVADVLKNHFGKKLDDDQLKAKLALSLIHI